MRAIVSGHGPAVKLLIAAGANADIPDNDGRTPLVRAVETLLDHVGVDNDTDIVKTLLDHGASAGAAEGELLVLVVQVGLQAGGAAVAGLFGLLVDEGFSREALTCPDDVWGSDRTALMRAVEIGDEAMIRFLISAGAPVSEPASSGETPLVWAAKRGSASLVRLLLECGCAADGAWLRTTPLAHAVREGRAEIAEILLGAGSRLGGAVERATGECLELLQSEAERRALVLTLHVAPSATDGFLDVVCTDMGGDELASVLADPGAPLAELRCAIVAELGDDAEFPPKLLLLDGRVLEDGDDRKLLGTVLGPLAPLPTMEDF